MSNKELTYSEVDIIKIINITVGVQAFSFKQRPEPFTNPEKPRVFRKKSSCNVDFLLQ